MRTVRNSNGDTIYIVKEQDARPDCVWFTEEEWAWAQRLGKSRSDPQEQKEFFMGLVEAKTANPNVSVFDLFPQEGSGEKADPNPTPNSPSAERAHVQDNARRKFTGEAICQEVIDQLRGRGARMKREREGEAG